MSHKDWRGLTSSFYTVLLSSGILCTFATGYFIQDWRTIAAVLTIPPTVFFIFMLFRPDSPYWLVEQGQNEKAKEALVWLRGSGEDCDEVCLQKTRTVLNYSNKKTIFKYYFI